MAFTGWQFCAVHATDAEVSAGSSFEMIVASIGPDAPVNIPTAVSTKAPTYWKPGELNQRNKVIQTVGEWSKYANVIFKQSDAGTIRISFNPAAANWSYIGTNCKTIAAANPTMNLGLVHEHRGPARGTPIHLSPAVMNSYYSMAFQWNSATTQALVLDLYNDVDVSNYADVDSASIMLFPIPAAATLEKTSTILQNTGLSNFDKAYMTIMYPRPTPDPSVPQWTATSLSYWTSAVANVDGIRQVMDNWLVSKRVTASKQPVTPALLPSDPALLTTTTPDPTTSTQTPILDPSADV
ncbi:hypothetical protein DL96DRAFT_1595007 [Flagelloscypha sp. PMI_526]|nr:hypothetical protein DL96DRAFT_1595007 [Flagelloscypha sp. PMI_526]